MASDDAGTQFYTALQQKATAAVGSIVHATLVPIQYPSQGDFAWDWLNPALGGPAGAFNTKTYDYASARVIPGGQPGTVALLEASSFPNAYSSLLQSIMFAFSKADQATLTAAQNNAALQSATIVADYQNLYGAISSAEIAQAGYANPIDYIVGQVLGSEWSGATPPLSYAQMAAARNLAVLLPKRPAGSDQILTDVGTYLSMMQPVATLLGLQQNGAWTLAQLRNNATTPSSLNGGMATFDPLSGSLSPSLALPWSVNQSVQSINNDLANTARTITLGMTTTQGSGSSLSVSVEGKAAFGIGELLSFDTSMSGSYDMSKSAGTSTECSVEMTWKGYSFVPLGPLGWSQATNVGWFSTDPVAQAVANQGKDVTGYTFVTAPPYDLGSYEEGGNFGLLTGLVVANYPDVTITYQHGDYAAFKQAWQEQVSGNLTLFGFIPLGSFSEGVYSSSYSESSDNSTFTVTFSASPQVTGLPQFQHTAYVIAGIVANPGAAG